MGDTGSDKALVTISPIEFASRFARGVRDQDQRYTWFLGAGCSISSGIPAAGGLVEKWLRELQALQGMQPAAFERWRQEAFPGFDGNRPAGHYAQVFRRCYPSEDEQQREIERICAGGEPSYGYATFAQLLSLPTIGERCNTVLTTNFDDLLPDALYMYGERRMRPQIITHEALARYVRIASHRPTIVKLHGDAHLDPKNMEGDTARLGEEISRRIHPFVQGSALVFVGYGGNDESIHRFFAECPPPALRQPIFWVGKHDPAPAFRDWLWKRGALRVEHTDFDRLMHYLRGALAFGHPQAKRWEDNYKKYLEQYKAFEDEIRQDKDSEEKAVLQKTSEEASRTLPTDWEYYVKAKSAKSADDSEAIYREGLKNNPNSRVLTGMFALFLENVRKDMDGAETFYKRALEADPKHTNALGNYATFLETVRKDMDGAETFYKRALETDPKHANTLGNYANFLQTARKDMEGAETFYKRALDADPKGAHKLGNYAQMLFAIGRSAEGLEMADRSLALATEASLLAEVLFYRLAHDPAAFDATLVRLKKVVTEGGRSEGWDFSTDIDAARKQQHPQIDLLGDLAKVISENAPLSILDKHLAWRDA
jgi:Tfp pilus assembly protein PilF